MNKIPDYASDTEFRKLLVRRKDVDLAACSLELARDALPHLELSSTLQWIAERGRELTGPIARALSERDALDELGRCLAETHGITGHPDAFQKADGSFLPRVIETGRGIPISLSVLYVAVAERAGMVLEGVAAPMHFLARCETAEGPLFVDAYSGGQILDRNDCLAWMRERTGLDRRQIEPSLRPADPRTTVIRMLNNLKALYTSEEDWPAALTVQQRLTALEPGSYQQRRDLALIALRCGQPGRTLNLLEGCLKTCPTNERDTLRTHLQSAKTQLARWN